MTKIADESRAKPADDESQAKPAADEPPVRTVVVPDRFLSIVWAILVAAIRHPFTTTILRVSRS